MENTLRLRTDLSHDGDGLVRFYIRAEREGFLGSTMASGGEQHPFDLAKALAGFPKSPNDSIKFKFGSDGTGTCDLEFQCIDGTGHVTLWISIEAAYSSRGSDRFQTATVFMRVEPSAIDRFCAALAGFVAGARNEAILHGVQEY